MCAIDRLGVEFPFRGDAVIWLWWWKRSEGRKRKWLSIGFEASFESPFDLAQFWGEWAEANRRIALEDKHKEEGF